MIATGPTAARLCRLLAAGAALLTVMNGAAAAPAITQFKATYFISIAGLTVGRARVEARFTPGQYATAIVGSTYGLSRFVSDATANMSGNGQIRGSRVLPNTYNLDTSEKGLATRVRMSLRGNAITDLVAIPDLVEASDRIAVRPGHKRNIVDPVGAFVVALDGDGDIDGEKACARTVSVFDGWQRFDVRMNYKHTKGVSGAYSGDVVVCGARYVPVAGHRPQREAVKYMTENTRLEIWLAPIEGTNLLVPYHVLIGTAVGDLVVRARNFEVSGSGSEQASAR